MQIALYYIHKRKQFGLKVQYAMQASLWGVKVPLDDEGDAGMKAPVSPEQQAVAEQAFAEAQARRRQEIAMRAKQHG